MPLPEKKKKKEKKNEQQQQQQQQQHPIQTNLKLDSGMKQPQEET